jgi:hypothetical protein
VSSLAHPEITFLGLDVHRDTISVAILATGREGPDIDEISHDEESIRRLVARIPEPRHQLRACYEAGPSYATGGGPTIGVRSPGRGAGGSGE